MADDEPARHAPFLTAEQQDFAAYVARCVGAENESRLGPKLDVIAQLLARLIEAIEEAAEREPSA